MENLQPWGICAKTRRSFAKRLRDRSPAEGGAPGVDRRGKGREVVRPFVFCTYMIEQNEIFVQLGGTDTENRGPPAGSQPDTGVLLKTPEWRRKNARMGSALFLYLFHTWSFA